ncbi:MAG: hypothetical protein DRI94_01830 [Bacteroidetes bacterium]|nr:MAG: hypothetical protein DRI94_01830 [Bacteroidota bacterium]
MKTYRQNKFTVKNIIIVTFLITLFFGCYRYPEFDDISYNEYRRVIGPEGGTINFYRNYEDDSIKDIVVKMEFPENAVDSLIVFNMYEFYDHVTENELYIDLNTEQFSNFLYFLPFYESEGYKAVLTDSTDINSIVQKHTSINFSTPVSVTYYPDFYENIPDNAKLYKIKIPAENEWSEEDNVWVKYNYQGYPDGYDDIDLIYLINGKWTENIAWGTGNISLYNWEEVANYSFDLSNQSVTFEINNTDNMYIIAVIN